jgi:hypothetical protein
LRVIADSQRIRGIDLACIARKQQSSKKLASPDFRGGSPDQGEEPGLEARFPFKPGFSIQNLQVSCLQRVLRAVIIPAAAGSGPTEAGFVQPHELMFQLLPFHSSNILRNRSICCFKNLVTRAARLYDQYERRRPEAVKKLRIEPQRTQRMQSEKIQG